MNSTILLVDDDEAHLYTMRLLLQHAGFDVKEAITGQDGLRLADQRPDLVILDLLLPDISGVEICRMLKTSPRTSTIPVIHITAMYPGTTERAAALAAGSDGYFTRPVNPARLLATIETLIARSAA